MIGGNYHCLKPRYVAAFGMATRTDSLPFGFYYIDS